MCVRIMFTVKYTFCIHTCSAAEMIPSDELTSVRRRCSAFCSGLQSAFATLLNTDTHSVPPSDYALLPTLCLAQSLTHVRSTTRSGTITWCTSLRSIAFPDEWHRLIPSVQRRAGGRNDSHLYRPVRLSSSGPVYSQPIAEESLVETDI